MYVCTCTYSKHTSCSSKMSVTNTTTRNDFNTKQTTPFFCAYVINGKKRKVEAKDSEVYSIVKAIKEANTGIFRNVDDARIAVYRDDDENSKELDWSLKIDSEISDTAPLFVRIENDGVEGIGTINESTRNYFHSIWTK
jgi:hypothetical protein